MHPASRDPTWVRPDRLAQTLVGVFLRFPLSWIPGPPDMPAHCGSPGLEVGGGGPRQLDLLPSTLPCAAASPDSARLCCGRCLCSAWHTGAASSRCWLHGSGTGRECFAAVIPFAFTVKPQVPGASPQIPGFPLLPAGESPVRPTDALPNKHQHADGAPGDGVPQSLPKHPTSRFRQVPQALSSACPAAFPVKLEYFCSQAPPCRSLQAPHTASPETPPYMPSDPRDLT